MLDTGGRQLSDGAAATGQQRHADGSGAPAETPLPCVQCHYSTKPAGHEHVADLGIDSTAGIGGAVDALGEDGPPSANALSEDSPPGADALGLLGVEPDNHTGDSIFPVCSDTSFE